MLKVDNKFDVGQEVYVISETVKTVQHTEKCDTCEGMGIIIYKGKKLQCPLCYNGKITTGTERIFAYSIGDHGKITSIRIRYTNKDSQSIRYKINGKSVPENMIALTGSDAIALCEELNTQNHPEPI